MRGTHGVAYWEEHTEKLTAKRTWNKKDAKWKASGACLGETFGVTNRQRHLEIHNNSIGELALNPAGTRCLTQWAMYLMMIGNTLGCDCKGKVRGNQLPGNTSKIQWKPVYTVTNERQKSGRIIGVKGSLLSSQVAHQAGAYPGFCSMKRLGVFLLPPGWDASPSQGYPLH